MTFTPGEIVDITLTGCRVARYERPGDGPAHLYVTLPGEPKGLPIEYPARGVDVKRAAPPEWPPQPGDVWTTPRGGVWFARDTADYDEGETVKVQLTSANEYGYGGDQDPDHVNQNYGPLRLAYRRELAEEAVES